MRGSITQGDVSSWIVAGSYVRHTQASSCLRGRPVVQHAALSRRQRAKRWRRCATAAATSARCTPSTTGRSRRACDVGYGAKYARYDYLADRGLFSPRASIAVKPSQRDSLTFRATASHREIAPGAEEFMPPAIGLWLPPERTFSHVSRARVPARAARSRRSGRRAHVAGRHPDRRARVPAARRRPGRHAVRRGASPMCRPASATITSGSAGDFEALGWGVSVSRVVGDRRSRVGRLHAGQHANGGGWSRDRDALSARCAARSCAATTAFTT